MIIKVKLRRIIFLIIAVMLSYLLFTFPPTLAPSPFNFNDSGYYGLLSQGFLSGQLSLPIKPSPQLLALPDPYDPIENAGLRLHDAVLYNGKYYLYFGPLPAVSFFIPFRLLTGVYPSETLSVFFFLSLGFIILFILMLKIKEKYFPELSEAMTLFSGLLLAFSTTAPFLLTRGLFYESAIASAFCSMSFALFFLYKAIEHHFSKITHVALFSFFLALSVSGRPNFSLILLVLIPIAFFCIIKHAPREKLTALIASLLLPTIIIAIILALYNYLRFDSFFQFGEKYQLSGVEVSKMPPMFHYTFKNTVNVIYYFFLFPFKFSTQYRQFAWLPHIHMKALLLAPAQLKAGYYYNPGAGFFMIAPIALFIFTFPFALKMHLGNNSNSISKRLSLFLYLISMIPLVIMLFYFSFPWGWNQRYQMDFAPYFILLSIISFWLLEKIQLKSWIFTTIKIIFIALGIISILIGFDIGITGYGV